MRILALETTTNNLSLALVDGEKVLAVYKSDEALTHARDLVPAIERLLKKACLGLADLDCFSVSIGPGSFTGLRVGVAMAKGLNLVTGIPIVAVPTLDATAHNARGEGGSLFVIVDAKKKNCYASLYKAQNHGIIRQWDYMLLPAGELIDKLEAQGIEGGVLFLGDGLALYGDLIRKRLPGAKLAAERLWYPDARVIAELGALKFRNGGIEDPDNLVPLYIYSQDCNVKGVYR